MPPIPTFNEEDAVVAGVTHPKNLSNFVGNPARRLLYPARI